MNYQPKNIAGKIAAIFLHNPITPVLAVVILLLGFVSLQLIPQEEDPQMQISGGSIIVALPGATPKEVENVIIKPLSRAMKEVKGVEYIYGMAANDVGIVNVAFFIGEDKEESNLKIYDKVMQNMDRLPKGAMSPVIKPFDIDVDVPIFTIAFYNKTNKLNDVDMFKVVRDIQQDLSEIKNSAKTIIKGEKKEQYNVEVDLGKLSAYHLSLGQIAKSIQSLAVSLPNINNYTTDGRMVVFGIKNAIDSVKDVRDIIVAKYQGSPIYLKSVASVTKGTTIQSFKSVRLDFRDGDKFVSTDQISLSISKLKGANAVTITKEINEYLLNKKDYLDSLGIGFIVTRDYGKRAEQSVGDLINNLGISIIIVAVLLIFTLSFKESVMVSFAIPAIFSITLFVALLSEQTINRITLFAFIVSLGILVDAAIIVVENINRHLKEKRAKKEKFDMDDVIIEATDEIGAPTNVATVAIIMTIVPMIFVGQMMGQFMKPLPLNIPVTIFASLVVAYIFMPYMARKLLK